LYHDCFRRFTGNYTAQRFITIKDTYLKDFILKILNEEGLAKSLKDEDFITNSVLLLIIVSLVYCAPKEDLKIDSHQKIKSVYFQKWIGGESKNSGTFLY
jgi:hypothetical protein